MDINNFKAIGIIDVYWTLHEFEYTWEKVFIEIYNPIIKDHKHGQEYAIRYVFLDNNNVKEEELVESYNLDFKYKDIDNDKYEVKMFRLKHIVNKKQLERIMKVFDLWEK